MPYFVSFLLPLGLLAASLPLAAQSVLSGQVVEAASGDPIAFATVYIDGTSIGDITTERGSFSLPLGGVSLPAVFIISHLNYRDTSLVIRQPGSRGRIALADSQNLLDAVEVLDKNQRERNLREFRRVFLGMDAWGNNASLSQTAHLVFNRRFERKELHQPRYLKPGDPLPEYMMNAQWSEDGESLVFEEALDLKAYSRQPLRVDLPDLGYKVQVGLQNFELEYKSGSYMSLGTFFFQAYEGEGKVKKKHQRNRLRAYYNSSQHFLRALYHNRLEEEGYQILEKKDRGIVIPFNWKPFLTVNDAGEVLLVGLKEKDLILAFYADNKGRPLPPSKWRGKQPLQSGLYIADDPVSLRADGTQGGTSLHFSGEMGRRAALAWLLPSNYEPW